MVLADLEEPTMEIDIYSNYGHYYGIQGKDDLIYLVDGDSNVVQLNYKRIRKETKVIEYITTGTRGFETFGSGYALNKNVLYPNEYALKVLSGDPDYDISVMNSALGESYNVKNNGAHYPLNKVKGIDDYLDACFPYVKEAAYNEQGDIWMIPLQVDIPGYLVNMKSVEKDQVLIKDNMTYDEFIELINTMDDIATNKYNVSNDDIYRNLLYSILSGKEDIDREKFSRIAGQLRDVHKKIMGANQYENGEIVFHIDRDIYYDDFMRYLEGEIDLENYIAETNRKLSIFKNE